MIPLHIELFKNSCNPPCVNNFYDHPGQPTEVKKDGGGKTVTSFYKDQLFI